VSPEKRDWIKKESENLFVKNQMLREKTKEDMFIRRMKQERIANNTREERVTRWQEKTKNSPFAVNLVAEDERITEENAIRIKEEETRRRTLQTRKDQAKNEIILKALGEFSDLEALRQEKRAIMDEEQRLKALLTLEKVTVSGKADRLVAERAQHHRHAAKLEHRRTVYRESLNRVIQEEQEALRKKHALPLNNLSSGGSQSFFLT